MGKISTIANYAEQLQLPQKNVLLKIIDLKVDNEMKDVQQSIRHLEERTDNKFKQMIAESDAKFKQMIAESNAKFAQVLEKFKAVDLRFDALEKSIDIRFDSVDKRFNSLEKSIDKRFNMLLWLFGAFCTVVTAGFFKSLFF